MKGPSSDPPADPGSDLPSDPISSPDSEEEGTVPEYLAPGVYVEETSFRPKAIQGVATIPLNLDASDPEWKYVRLSRYFAYLEDSIDEGTKWVVFEPNGPRLWKAVRRLIEDFLSREWKRGRLQGDKSEDAYFVRCDRTTMTEDDIDNGRLICIIGVAPSRPAEFVIFRIGQKTTESSE